MPDMQLRQIGVIHSPYRSVGEAPRQGRLREVISEIVVFEEYSRGIGDMDQISHIFVLYWLDRADRTMLTGTPPGTTRVRGVFTTRSPHRPNPVGLGIGRVIAVKDNVISVSGLDALDGTPLIDIKPYSAQIDAITNARDDIGEIRDI